MEKQLAQTHTFVVPKMNSGNRIPSLTLGL
jgi:hypothetical protein